MPTTRREFSTATHQVLGDPRYATAARDFAARHLHHRPDEVATQIVDDLEAMLVDGANLRDRCESAAITN